MKQIILILIFSLLLFSCKKESYHTIPLVNKGVLTVNEGNFNWGNATLSLYNNDDNSITKDVFKEVNGIALGDVAQSAIRIDSLVYVVMNNSAKIIVLSSTTFKQKLVIPISGSSPRFILPINDSIAYVTELYANKIWIIDYKLGLNKGFIAVDGETNQMVKVNETVFVAERTKFSGASVAQIRVINSITHQTTKVVPLPTQPNSICKDLADNVWVLTDTGGGKPASLIAIDAVSLTVAKKIDFVSGKTPQRLRYNGVANTLCYLSGSSVYSMGANTYVLPSNPLFTVAAAILYAFDIDANGKYYLADAIDYTQSSMCFVYNADGTQQSTFNTGINTNQFVFLP